MRSTPSFTARNLRKIEELVPEILLKEKNQMFFLASRLECESWDAKEQDNTLTTVSDVKYYLYIILI